MHGAGTNGEEVTDVGLLIARARALDYPKGLYERGRLQAYVHKVFTGSSEASYYNKVESRAVTRQSCSVSR